MINKENINISQSNNKLNNKVFHSTLNLCQNSKTNVINNSSPNRVVLQNIENLPNKHGMIFKFHL